MFGPAGDGSQIIDFATTARNFMPLRGVAEPLSSSDML